MWILILFLLCSPAIADVYVVTTPNHSVYSLSEENDAVVPDGYSKDVLKGRTIESLALHPVTSLYDYSNGQFTLNKNRVASKNAADQAAVQTQADLLSAKASAIAKLKALGLTEAEINGLLK